MWKMRKFLRCHNFHRWNFFSLIKSLLVHKGNWLCSDAQALFFIFLRECEKSTMKTAILAIIHRTSLLLPFSVCLNLLVYGLDLRVETFLVGILLTNVRIFLWNFSLVWWRKTSAKSIELKSGKILKILTYFMGSAILLFFVSILFPGALDEISCCPIIRVENVVVSRYYDARS